MQGKIWVSAAEACNEVILERLNGTFSSIPAMDSYWCFLEIDVLIMDVVL